MGGCVAELPRHLDRDTGNGVAPIVGFGGEVGDSVDTCMDVHVTFAVTPDTPSPPQTGPGMLSQPSSFGSLPAS